MYYGFWYKFYQNYPLTRLVWGGSKTDEIGEEGLGRRGLWEEGILQSHRWQAHVRLPTINNYCLSPWRRHGDNKRMNYHDIVWYIAQCNGSLEKEWKKNGKRMEKELNGSLHGTYPPDDHKIISSGSFSIKQVLCVSYILLLAYFQRSWVPQGPLWSLLSLRQ